MLCFKYHPKTLLFCELLALTRWPHIFLYFSLTECQIMLSPNDPSFFEPVLSPNAPACWRAGLTPVSTSYLTAPPPVEQLINRRGTVIKSNFAKKWRHKSSVGDWPKSCLFMYKHICAYCRINTKNVPIDFCLQTCPTNHRGKGIGLYKCHPLDILVTLL